jgi:hypothetical protein
MGDDLGQSWESSTALGLATWGPSLSGRAFGSLALPRGGAAVGGRARGGPPRSCPQVAPAPTNPLYASHTRREAAGQSPGEGSTRTASATTRSTRAMPSAEKVQKKSLAAGQRVRGGHHPSPLDTRLFEVGAVKGQPTLDRIVQAEPGTGDRRGFTPSPARSARRLPRPPRLTQTRQGVSPCTPVSSGDRLG